VESTFIKSIITDNQDDNNDDISVTDNRDETEDDDDFGFRPQNQFAKGPPLDGGYQRPLLLAHNQFKLHNEQKQRTVEQHYITKFAKDWNLHLASSKENTAAFYKELKTHTTQYNVLLLDYHDITKEKGIEAIMPDTCDNYASAKKAMSRALYVMFLAQKDEMFKSKYHKDLLLNYEDEEDGLAFLKELITPHHLALKQKSETEGTNNQPEFTTSITIFEYIRQYKRWVQEEKRAQIPRQYTDMDNAANIRKQMEKHDKYAIPTEHLKSELAKVENKQKPFPKNLTLQFIALTLFNKIPPEERFEDDDIEEGSTSNPITIHKFIKSSDKYKDKKYEYTNNKRNNNSYNHSRSNEDRHSTSTKSTQSKGDQQLQRRIFDPDKKCNLCGMYGHDGEKGNGCDAMATHMAITKAENKMSFQQKKTIREKWKEHQESSRQFKMRNKKGRNLLRNELRKLQETETPETYYSIRKFTVDSYKDRYPEEDWVDPFSDPANGISDYEDLESDESADDN
jgi:hypothetical protein